MRWTVRATKHRNLRAGGFSSMIVLGLLFVAGGCKTSNETPAEPVLEPQKAASDAGNQAVKDVMMGKMVHANGVLSGITMGDFRLIEQSANELAFLSRLAEWQVHDTPEYLMQSQQFRGTVEALAAAAGRRDMEACESAYAQMTRSCLLCHSYLREQGLVDMPVQVSIRSQ